MVTVALHVTSKINFVALQSIVDYLLFVNLEHIIYNKKHKLFLG
jgi:hypothetical protein